MTDKPFLTLAFSTVGTRVAALIPLLDRLAGCDVEILVVVQKWTDGQRQEGELAGWHWIWTDTIGLSRSRNLALEAARGEFVWLLDDDVDIEPESLMLLKTELAKADEHVIRVRVGCLENRAGLYKAYSDSHRFSRLMLLQMNSIELILRRQWMIDQQIRFNPNIGLGTDFPGAEETHFLLDAVGRGAVIRLLNQAFVYHSCSEGGRRKVQSDAMMEIRGATASRFGLMGLALLGRWSLRYLIEYRRLSVVKALLKGFFNGYRHYC